MTLFVTGATGIAEATALLAGAQGWNVFIASIDEHECSALANQSPNAAYRAGDLRDEAAVDAAFENCTRRFGAIDSVFHVAGGSGRAFGDGPIHECSAAGWQHTFELNTFTAFLVSRAAVRHWLSAGNGGSLLNISSVLASSPEPVHFGTHAYASSKGAVNSMSKAIAAYYADRQIRSNVLAPGLVRTPMSIRAQMDPLIPQFVAKKQLLSRGFLEVDEIARAAMFLLGGESRNITGQVLTVDGGWSLISP